MSNTHKTNNPNKVMSKSQKRLLQLRPGCIGAVVVSGDLNSAIRQWKQELKTSNILKTLYDKQEYVKPSIKRKEIIENAKHRNKFIVR